MRSHSSIHNPVLRLLVMVAALLFSLIAAAEGSVERGAQKAVTCAACHGQDGNSLNPEWPSLAGQHEKYLVDTLQAYKGGKKRNNVLMLGQVAALSDQDMQDLAAYFSAQKPTRRMADPELVERGERLYRGGDMERSISACIACHGPRGRGNPAAGYPVLAGQHATYTAAQLRAYSTEERSSDPNKMMRSIASQMTEKDIAAVASYIQGLR